MSGPADAGGGGPGRRDQARAQARALAEQALHAQAEGRDDEADHLFAEAQRIDPDEVADVLAEHDAARPPDARDQPAADRDAERIVDPAQRTER